LDDLGIFALPDRFEQHPDFHDVLKTLRESAPVRQVEMPDGRRPYLVLRHAEVRAMFNDPRMSSDPRYAAEVIESSLRPGLPNPIADSLAMDLADPPGHTRMRRAAAKSFAPGQVAALRPTIVGLTAERLDALAPTGQADIIKDLAFPVPMAILAQMLGIPEDDRDRFCDWALAILLPPTSVKAARAAGASRLSLFGYLLTMVAAQREHPTEDLLGRLAQLGRDENLPDEQLIMMMLRLLFAGHESTVNTIGNSIINLLGHPNKLRHLRENPDGIAPAITELLRYEGPDLGMARFTKEEVTIDGITIPAGHPVILGISPANRDPAVFDNPDELRLDRPEATHHVSFGHGNHFCLAAELSKVEVETIVGAIITRLPNLALAKPVAELPRSRSASRGVTSIPVHFTPTTTA
jgi:cytochrome P450